MCESVQSMRYLNGVTGDGDNNTMRVCVCVRVKLEGQPSRYCGS